MGKRFSVGFYRLENGNGNPTLKTLKKLASALGCRLELKFTKLPSEA